VEVGSENFKRIFKKAYDLQYQAAFGAGSAKESNLKKKTRRKARCCIW